MFARTARRRSPTVISIIALLPWTCIVYANIASISQSSEKAEFNLGRARRGNERGGREVRIVGRSNKHIHVGDVTIRIS